MKYVAYFIFVLASIHAFGCVVGHNFGYLVVSVLIAAVGILLLQKSKAGKPDAPRTVDGNPSISDLGSKTANTQPSPLPIMSPPLTAMPPPPVPESGQKTTKFWPAFLLAFFLGIFAAHRFYLKSPKRVLMLCTLGGFGIWAFIDSITLLIGKFKDEQGQLIANPKPILSWSIFAVAVIVFAASNNSGGGKLWDALTSDKAEYAADVPMGEATVHVRTVFFDSSSGKGFVTEGQALSLNLKFLGTEPKFEITDTAFTITFSVSQVRDGNSFRKMGTAVVSGTFDPKTDKVIREIHYKESFDSAAGLEYDLIRN